MNGGGGSGGSGSGGGSSGGGGGSSVGNEPTSFSFDGYYHNDQYWKGLDSLLN